MSITSFQGDRKIFEGVSPHLRPLVCGITRGASVPGRSTLGAPNWGRNVT